MRTGKRVTRGEAGVREDLRGSWVLTCGPGGSRHFGGHVETAPRCQSYAWRWAPLACGHSATSTLTVMPGRGGEVGRDQQGGHMKASLCPSL